MEKKKKKFQSTKDKGQRENAKERGGCVLSVRKRAGRRLLGVYSTILQLETRYTSASALLVSTLF